MNRITMRAIGLATLALVLAAPAPASGATRPETPPEPASASAPSAPDRPMIVVRTPEGERAFWLGQLLPARRAFVGVRLSGMTAELREHFGAPGDRGLLVARVVPESPAARAGLAAGDIVLALDGEPVASVADFQRLVFEHEPGEHAVLTVLRDGDRKAIDVELGAIERRRLDLGRFALFGPKGTDLERLVEEAHKVAGRQRLRQIEIAPIEIDQDRLERVLELVRRYAEAGVAAAADAAQRSTEAPGPGQAREEALERRREELERRMRELERKIEQLERRLGER